jgi:hypothetical protein
MRGKREKGWGDGMFGPFPQPIGFPFGLASFSIDRKGGRYQMRGPLFAIPKLCPSSLLCIFPSPATHPPLAHKLYTVALYMFSMGEGTLKTPIP